MKLIKIILAMAGLVATPIVTIAGEDSQLTINEEPFVTSVAAPAHLENVDTIYSGWTFRTDETQALKWTILIIQHLFLLIKPLILLTQWTGQLEKRASHVMNHRKFLKV